MFAASTLDTHDGTLRFDWGGIAPLINIGVQTGLSWLTRPQTSACMQSTVSGDEAMTACVPHVMSQFDNLQAQAPFMQPGEIVAAANQIAGIFSDPRYFDQNIGGRSREIREAAKVQARQRADQIIAAVTAAVQQQQPATQTPIATIGGFEIDTQTVLIAGGALFALIFLLKR